MKLISEMNKEQFEEEPYNIGGALNLNVYNKDVEVARMYKKVEAGASFFLTQPIYEKKVIAYLPKIKRLNGEKILGGIMPIVSYRNAQFLNNEIPGIKIPDDYINRFKEDMQRDEAEEVGIEIAVEIANKIKQHVDGFYLVTPFNRVHMIAKILHKIL
jgi:homocysteine S-methyltransferase